MNDESDPTNVDCWYNQLPDSFFFLPKENYCAKYTIYYSHTNTLDAFDDGEVFTQQCYVH